ncbi:MAG: helix-turn-helix transcriptional regulator [Anaerolineae bacterium]|nr:helix-turn-helix transcriptional regulator [Anaerolineae bacterium]
MTERKIVFRGDRLRQLRSERLYSQDDLNKLIGAGKANQVNRYETGKTEPSSDVLYKLAQALGVSADYLLGLVDEPTSRFQGKDITPNEYKLVMAVRRCSPEVRSTLNVLFSSISDVILDEERERQEKWDQ